MYYLTATQIPTISQVLKQNKLTLQLKPSKLVSRINSFALYNPYCQQFKGIYTNICILKEKLPDVFKQWYNWQRIMKLVIQFYVSRLWWNNSRFKMCVV